jgi:hypothetical protein
MNNKENKELLKKVIRELTKSRNQINNIRDNVRWFDADTTMVMLGTEICNIDQILTALVYIKDHDKEN